MGSTSKSGKRNDRSPLLSPRATGGNSGGAGGLMTKGEIENEDVLLACKGVFKVELIESPLLREGLSLLLKGNKVLLFSVEVGQLTVRQRAMIEGCKALGIEYDGVVARAGKDKHYYGFFKKR